MKRTMTIGLLGAILAVAVGFISTNAISATPFFMAASDLSSDESAYMIGHVEYTVRGADGQIKQYVQGDNLIVDRGRNCVAQGVFDPLTVSPGSINFPTCTISADGFRYIAIGNGTHVDDPTLLHLAGNVPGTDCDGDNTTQDTCEMQRKAGVVHIVSTSGVNPNTVVTIDNTADPFLFNHAGSILVGQSGLFDEAADFSGNLFAAKQVMSITVEAVDSLAVTWTITLGQ